MSTHSPMTLKLSPDQAEQVRAAMESHGFASPQAMLDAALAAWRKAEDDHAATMESIRQRVQASLNDPRPTPTVDEVFARLERRLES